MITVGAGLAPALDKWEFMMLKEDFNIVTSRKTKSF